MIFTGRLWCILYFEGVRRGGERGDLKNQISYQLSYDLECRVRICSTIDFIPKTPQTKRGAEKNPGAPLLSIE